MTTATAKRPPAQPTASDAIFIASPEGFRAENAGRAPAMLVKELVQNAFDEGPSTLTVEIEHDAAAQAVRLRVEDDVAGGIRDLSYVFTLWASDKQDSPRKRGRMGRGLKEVIAVSDRALILTERHGGILFERSSASGRPVVWTRTPVAGGAERRGTLVEVSVGLWGPESVEAITEFLRRMRPPEGLRFVVNGTVVVRTAARERYALPLPTVVYEQSRTGRRALERRGTAAVEIIEAQEPWIFEMGIPVEALASFPFSIDVDQRIPLRDRRDTVTDAYRRELYARLLEVRATDLQDHELHDEWVHVGAQRADLLSGAVKERVAEAYTQGAAYATSGAAMRDATGMHIRTIALRALPEPIRTIVREVGQNAMTLVEERVEAAATAARRKPKDDHERRTVGLIEEIARGIGRPCAVALYSGQPNHGGASWNDTTRTLNLWPDKLGRTFFAKPFSAATLRIVIHELAHWEPLDEAHGFDYDMDAEDVGAAVAALAFERGPELQARFGPHGGTQS